MSLRCLPASGFLHFEACERLRISLMSLYDDMNSRDLAALQEQLQKERTSSASHIAEKAALVRAVKVVP